MKNNLRDAIGFVQNNESQNFCDCPPLYEDYIIKYIKTLS